MEIIKSFLIKFNFFMLKVCRIGLIHVLNFTAFSKNKASQILHKDIIYYKI